MEIKFTVTTENLARIKAATKGLFSIPETCDDEKVCTPDFTDTQWVKEVLRRYVVHNVHRWEQTEARRQNDVAKDDNLIT